MQNEVVWGGADIYDGEIILCSLKFKFKNEYECIHYSLNCYSEQLTIVCVYSNHFPFE